MVKHAESIGGLPCWTSIPPKLQAFPAVSKLMYISILQLQLSSRYNRRRSYDVYEFSFTMRLWHDELVPTQKNDRENGTYLLTSDRLGLFRRTSEGGGPGGGSEAY